MPSASEDEIALTMQAIEALTVAGSFDHPSVDFSDATGQGPGVDVFVGTRDSIARLAARAGETVTTSKPMSVERGADGQRMPLILTADSAIELATRVREFAGYARQNRPGGTAQGLRALTNLNGRDLAPGQTVRLADLGFVSRQFPPFGPDVLRY